MAERGLLVLLLGLGVWLAQLFPSFPRVFHLIVPLILLGLMSRIAVMLAARQGLDADLARGMLDQVRVTVMGTDAGPDGAGECRRVPDAGPDRH